MSISRRRSMVQGDHATLSIVRQCKLLKLSRSGLYYKYAGVSSVNQAVMHEIDKIFTDYPFFGVRQMRAYL